jgi:hypothetical protein
MKTALPLVVTAVLLSGCSLLTKEPSEARKREMEQDALLAERRDPLNARAKAIDARAREYEEAGFNKAEARAKAIADAWPKPKS